jgi:glyoxylase-like metal-dependent hydrolase (beta-lactamase superfamily II)
MAGNSSSNIDSWRAPGPQPVAAHVHRIPVPLPTSIRAVNLYALESPDGLTLVDGGWAPYPEARERLVQALRSLGAALGDVRHFLVTHAHRDHYSYAVEHRSEFGSQVWLGAGEAASLAAFRAEPTRPHPYMLDQLRRGGAMTSSTG